MLTYQQQKQQVVQFFQEAIAIAKNQQDDNLVIALEKAQKRLIEEKLYVVICGEFKQGKSSLINSFIDETNLFPVNVDIATNMISEITYGKEEKISVILGDRENSTTKQISRAEIPDYVTEQGNKNNSKNARILRIESPNPQLKEGLVLVDTPGTGSINPEHTAVTYSYIPNADVILFVSDVLSPLKVEELNFIQDRIIPHCQNLIFVVTKIDTMIEYENIVNSNREKLAKLLNKPATEICIIPVSSQAKQDYLQDQDDEDLKNSYFPQLQETVWTLVKENRGQILLIKALGDLGRILIQIKRPLETEFQSYQQRSQEELNQWEEKIKKTQQDLRSFLQDNAEWKTSLADGLRTITSDTQYQFKEEFVKLQRQSEKYLNDPNLLKNPQQIATLLEADIDGMMFKLAKEVNSQAADLYGELEEQTGLYFDPFSVSDLGHQQAKFRLEDIQIKKTSLVDKSMTVGRSGIFNAGAGSFIGGLLGGIGGAVAGFFAGGVGAIPGAIAGASWGSAIGGIGGGAKGAIDGIKQIPKQDQDSAKIEIRKILKIYLEDSQMLCNKALTKVIDSLQISIRNELNEQIKQQKDSYDKTLDALQQARKVSQVQGVENAKKLQQPLAKINQIQQFVENLANSVMSSSNNVSQPKTPKATTTANNKGDNGDFADG